MNLFSDSLRVPASKQLHSRLPSSTEEHFDITRVSQVNTLLVARVLKALSFKYEYELPLIVGRVLQFCVHLRRRSVSASRFSRFESMSHLSSVDPDLLLRCCCVSQENKCRQTQAG